MNETVQKQVELSAVLNLIPYLDTDFNYSQETTLLDLVLLNEKKFTDDEGELKETFKLLKEAVLSNEEYQKIVLVDQSSTNETGEWKDDLIQACTFRDADGNYYVTYRGTGDGRWADNGDGMTEPSTEMQEEAAKYFDKMAEKYLIEASNQGKDIIVTGHSKGGNEAQYVYMASRHEEIIDNCISIDGQGFSQSAKENFIERFGDEYEDKLSNMYSINGTNDYVHDLGFVIILEENTYFVGSRGSSIESFHSLEAMVGKNGEYTGLEWVNPETGLPYEQGEIGQLAKKISKIMMQLDSEDLNGAAVAIMIFVDAFLSGNMSALIGGEFDQYILGELKVNIFDFVDLFAHGLPAVIEALLLTPEGREILKQLIIAKTQEIYEAYGVGGVLMIYAASGLLLTHVVAPLLLDVILYAQLLDFVIDVIATIIDISEQIAKFFTEIKDAIVDTVKKIGAKIRTYTAGYQYVSANPQIIIDTYKLSNYAQRIRSVNSRISSLEDRIDSLYWRVGLLDLWNLMQADLLTGYSWRLQKCASYLSNTANDFTNVENDLAGKI